MFSITACLEERQNTETNSKDILERIKEFNEGDFVTTDDNDPLRIYVVVEIKDGLCYIRGIKMSPFGDYTYVEDIIENKENLFLIDESLVQVDGHLWRVRDEVRANIKK